MKRPPRWTVEEMEEQRQIAVQRFCTERMKESLEPYLKAFDKYRADFEALLRTTGDLSSLEQNALEVLTTNDLLLPFRYLTGPPVSKDDLVTLADVPSLTKSTLNAQPEAVQRLLNVIRSAIDRRRFVWVGEGRPPTRPERNAAIIGSAALLAASHVQTSRRNTSKKHQELAVKDFLIKHGFSESRAKPIKTLSSGPAAATFCGETMLGTRKADIVVRLWDERLMPVECKVSNSAINSVKRLNNDAAVKAEAWTKDFGMLQIVPAAVLSGVYKLDRLMEAQERGLTIFWAHDLHPLAEWVDSTR